MQAIIKVPADCSQEELSTFEQLVLEGGEVATPGLLGRIKSAYKLIFIELDNKFISVGALKRPNENYKNKVFFKAGVVAGSTDYQYELGYMYTSPASRGNGVGSFLMKSVCDALNGQHCFATTRENNEVMHHLFDKASFKRLGKAYKSDKGDYYLGLFVTK
ncbi:GNAT family N-acetyltransferase [Pseudoalteromonas galatheae]|uniref:GNAT family N-acetyltransferase n=1 Tax=Pseudoalteromonas galatheae TaxID=579562 RepID=UPI0030D1C5BB